MDLVWLSQLVIVAELRSVRLPGASLVKERFRKSTLDYSRQLQERSQLFSNRFAPRALS